MQIFKSFSPEATHSLAQAIGRGIPAGTVLALYGDLGAGKTLFAQGLAKGLNIQERVKSPTFILMEEYTGRLPFAHIDAYRLTEDEIWEAGLGEALDGNKVVLIEWAGNFGSYLPSEALSIHLTKHYTPDGEWRELFFHCAPGEYPWLDQALAAAAPGGGE